MHKFDSTVPDNTRSPLLSAVNSVAVSSPLRAAAVADQLAINEWQQQCMELNTTNEQLLTRNEELAKEIEHLNKQLRQAQHQTQEQIAERDRMISEYQK